jgi:cyclopropane fatty-acyl-phospholipid synthase-like methyltransferase
MMHDTIAVARPTGRGPLWSDRTVAWYRRANDSSDYAAAVLRVASAAVARARTALDVGAGFGALALPLARRIPRVTALEPSAAMAAALREDAARAGLPGVEVIQAAWGEVDVAPHDLVVCAHVSPLLSPGSPFLAALPHLARRAVILVRDAPGGDDKFFFPQLYPLLLGRPYEHGCDWSDTVTALDALGIHPAVTLIEYRSDQPFDSLEEACDFWMTYMGLTTADHRHFLRGFLRTRLQRRGEGWVAPFRKRAAVMHWTVDAPENPA